MIINWKIQWRLSNFKFKIILTDTMGQNNAFFPVVPEFPFMRPILLAAYELSWYSFFLRNPKFASPLNSPIPTLRSDIWRKFPWIPEDSIVGLHNKIQKCIVLWEKSMSFGYINSGLYNFRSSQISCFSTPSL